MGNARQIPGQESEHTVLKPHEKEREKREKDGYYKEEKGGEMGGDVQPNGTPASVWEIFDALQLAWRVFLGLRHKESRSSGERA